MIFLLQGRRASGDVFLRENFPPPALTHPLKDSDYLVATPASKSIIPELMRQADTRLSKKDFYQIAAQMLPAEVHPEVVEKLDAISKVLL